MHTIDFLPNPTPGTLWPLDCVTPLPDILLAGRKLRAHQIAAWGKPGSRAVWQWENAWLAAADLARLLAAGPGHVLVGGDGVALAGTCAPEAHAAASPLVAGASSRLLRHPWELLAVNEEIVSSIVSSDCRGELSSAAQVDGILVLGIGSRVLPGVYIEGNVVVGDHCKIGPNCYLRGNTSIGDNCHIGQAVEIKNSLIGARVNIGHLSYVGDSVVGNDVNFGAGTITSNLRHDGENHRSLVAGVLLATGRRKFGTIVGEGVHTGIHTAIYPGRKLGPGTMTRPGAVVQTDLHAED